jgi:hypothetical protein
MAKIPNGNLRTVHRKKQAPGILTPSIDQHLNDHGGDILVGPDSQIIHALLEKPDRYRGGAFSPSGLSGCKRAQIFGFLDVPIHGGVNFALMAIFADGTWRHLKWQTMLLNMGAIEEAEVYAEDPARRLKGSADGINRKDNWLLEIKGINTYGFANLVQTQEPNEHHLDQVHGYFELIGDVDRAVFLYEDKNNQQWKEFVQGRESARSAGIADEIDSLNLHIEDRALPPVLDECKNGKGKTFNDCPYSHTCLGKTWESLDGAGLIRYSGSALDRDQASRVRAAAGQTSQGGDRRVRIRITGKGGTT